MAKADLGTKRACLACGMRFYDLSRSPIICPGCGAEFDPDNLIKTRKGRPVTRTSSTSNRAEADENRDESVEPEEYAENIIVEDSEDNIDFDDDGINVDEDGPGVIQDDISDDDELLTNLNDKDEG